MPTQSRFHPINSITLRMLRRKLGWSQAELGKRAGYCERVIRKAEAGGSLNIETIKHLAETFLSHNVVVSVKELIYSEEMLARCFMESLDKHGNEMLDKCGCYLADDFIYSLPAERSVLQLAGTYHGKKEFQQFLDRFYTFFARKPDTLNPTYLTTPGRVVAHFDDVLCFYAHELPSVWVNMHFYFRDGLIYRIENQFDYVVAITAIDAIRKKLGLG